MASSLLVGSALLCLPNLAAGLAEVLPPAVGNSGDFWMQKLVNKELPRSEREEAASIVCLGDEFMSAEEYTLAINKACTHLKFWRVASETISEMRKRSLQPTVSTHVAMINSCGRRSWDRATSELWGMRTRGLDSTLTAHQAVIVALEFSGRWAAVTRLLALMERNGPTPGVQEYSAALRVCDNGGRRQLVESLLSTIEGLISGEQMGEYEREGLWQQALDLLLKQAPSAAAYGAVIRSCGRSAEWPVALQLLSELQGGGLWLDVGVYEATIVLCAERGQWEGAVLLIREVQRLGLPVSAAMFGHAISACAVGGQWQWALALLREMDSLSLAPDREVYGLVVCACGQGGEWKWVLSLLNEMKERGFRPGLRAYLAAVRACELGGQQQWAKQLRHEMQERGLEEGVLPPQREEVLTMDEDLQWRFALEALARALSSWTQPSAAPYTDAVIACDKGGQWRWTLVLLEEMGQARLEVAGTLACEGALKACGSWQLALGLLALVQGLGFNTDSAAYNAVVEACQREREQRRALEVLDEMQLRELELDSDVYSGVLSAQKLPVGRRPLRSLRTLRRRRGARR